MIKIFCKNNGIKVNWLAEQMGIGENLLRYYLDRETPMHIKTRVAEVLNKHGYSTVEFSESLLKELKELKELADETDKQS